MAAPKGNQFWKLASPLGPKRKFETEEALWDKCVSYFEWVHANPLGEEKVFCSGGKIKRTHIKKMRAMTLSGLCVYLNIHKTTWVEWRKTNQVLSSIVQAVDEIIREQKFTGAASDLLNPNIIARDLGLTDKKEVKAVVTNREIYELTDEQLTRIAARSSD